MAKKTHVDAGKNFIKKVTGKVIQQGKDKVRNSATKKINELTNDFMGKSNENRKSTSETENEFSEADLRNRLNELTEGLASGDPVEAVQVFNNLVKMAEDVTKFCEVQKTKRKEIEAIRDIVVSKIQSQKEIILTYLEKSFDERKDNFSKFFAIIDDAIAKDNMQQLAMGLDSVNKLAATSPFKALASIESTQKALTDKKHIWDF